MPQATELQPSDPEVTFNVISMTGSTARLLPFALSLLQSPGVRLRLVANACNQSEIDLLAAAAATDERITHEVMPFEHPIQHGLALNHLFEAHPEPYFAFADSDVFASGDFLAEMLPLDRMQAGAFTGAPVWLADDEATAPTRARGLSGRRRALDDGTAVGSTYCAIYDRAAVESVWRDAPRGFAVHHTHMIPRRVRKELSARGWRFQILDTARLINLQLLLAGFGLEDRRVSELHHVGGFSVRNFEGPGGVMRSLRGLLYSSSERRIQRVAEGAMTRLYAKTQHGPLRTLRKRRRQLVVSYLEEVIDAILAGESTPPPPRSDSPEVDQRLRVLVEALEREYPRGVASLRESTNGRFPPVPVP